MKSITQQISTIIIALFFTFGAFADDAKIPANHPAMPASTDTGNTNRLYGKVMESMDVDNYTYVQINTGEQTHWAAGPKTSIKKGAMIAFEAGMPFTDFESKSLKKSFKTIYFVNRFITDQPGQTAPPTNPHANIQKQDKPVAIKQIKKAAGGKTVAEVFKQKKSLTGKTVQVRGQVVKYTAKVMGKNWLHIQDSSGDQKLVVTTDKEVKNGDVVLVSGTLATDRDLGYGYIYEILIEQAKVTVE